MEYAPLRPLKSSQLSDDQSSSVDVFPAPLTEFAVGEHLIGITTACNNLLMDKLLSSQVRLPKEGDKGKIYRNEEGVPYEVFHDHVIRHGQRTDVYVARDLDGNHYVAKFPRKTFDGTCEHKSFITSLQDSRLIVPVDSFRVNDQPIVIVPFKSGVTLEQVYETLKCVRYGSERLDTNILSREKLQDLSSEYSTQELEHNCVKSIFLSLKQASDIIYDLHSNEQISHGDVIGRNILIMGSPNNTALLDFGDATNLRHSSDPRGFIVQDVVGLIKTFFRSICLNPRQPFFLEGNSLLSKHYLAIIRDLCDFPGVKEGDQRVLCAQSFGGQIDQMLERLATV